MVWTLLWRLAAMLRVTSFILLPSFLLSLLLGACTATEPERSVVVDVDAADIGKADDYPIVVAYDDFTLTIESHLKRRGDLLVLQGKTNRHVEAGSAVVRSRIAPEARPFGTYTQLSVQRFELELTEDEALELLAGANVIFVWDMVRDDLGTYAAQVTTAAGISVHDGWSFNPQSILETVVADGRIQLRVEGRTSSRWYGFGFVIGQEVLDPQRIGEDERAFRIDVPPELLMPMVGRDSQFRVTQDGSTGRFSIGVRRVEVRHSDRGADAFYYGREVSCWRGTQRCLEEDLEAGTLDLSKCGSTMDVLACESLVGVHVTEADATAAATAAAVTAEDMTALVGESRAAALAEGVNGHTLATLLGREGAWYLDDEARDASLADEAQRAASWAIAYPFEFVDPVSTVRTSDPEEAKAIAADAFLQYLPTYDFFNSEFQSTYLDIVRRDRSSGRGEHLQAIGAIYAGVTNEDEEPYIEVQLESPPFHFMFGWLGAYIELSVRPDRDPGVYLEID